MSAPQRRRPSEPAERLGRPERPERSKVGFFVAAHVAAVALLYGVALTMGGGLSPPPFPPDVRGAARTPAPKTHRASATGAAGAATTVAAGTALGTTSSAALPAWAQRHEAIAPWEGR